MTRKIISLCLVCLLLFGLLPTMASAETYNNEYYDMTTITPSGTLYFNSETQTIIGGSVSGDLVIPSSIYGVPVLTIGNNAFQNNTALTSLVLPEGLITVSSGAFNLCNNLRSIVFPSTLETIGNYGFRKAPITQFSFPDSLVYIGEHAFSETKIENLVLPDRPLFLEKRAFSQCHTFTEIVIPPSVTLSEGVFRDCGALVKVTLPDNLTELPDSLFANCDNLREINLPSALEVIGNSCFEDCDRLSHITFPSTLRTIGAECFYSCRELESVVFPDSVTSIGSNAFYDCPLEEIALPKNLERLGYRAFYGTDIPFVYLSSGAYLENWLVGRPVGIAPRYVTVEEGTVGIAEGAAYMPSRDHYEDKTIIELPSTLKYVYADCFQSTGGANHIGTLTVHPDNPYLSSVDNVLYSKDLTSLIFCGNYVYTPNMKLPSQLKRIEDKAFYNCTSLTSITLPDSVEYVGDYALSNFYLQSVTLSKNLRTIGDYAFAGYNSLKTLVIPGKVETIGDYAFSGCVNLYAVNFGKNIRTIGDYAFNGAPLQQVVLGEKVESIGDYAFSNVKLRFLHLGSSLRTVGDFSFSHNPDLRDVVFPATLEELGDMAFYHCDDLERAVFHGPAPRFGNRVFYYVSPTSSREEFLPKLTIYYSQPEGWSEIKTFYVKYWEDAPLQVYLDVPKDSWYATSVDYVSGNGLMNGVGSGRFSPNSTMTRAMVVTVLWRLQGSPVVEKAHNFTDIAPSDWYAEAVNWAFARGIANGITDTLFKPDSSITREQLATLLYRYTLVCDPQGISQGTLPDFPDRGTVSSYATEALAWACTEGLINGVKEGSVTYLRPKSSATRAQVAAILMRYTQN